MHQLVGIGGVALAATLAFGAGGAAGALGDEPLPDPTNPPVYMPSPGTVPVTTLPAPSTSSKLELLSGRRLVLDARRLRTTVEVRCGYATTGRCDANGQLFVTLGGKRTQIGSWQGLIPGQQVFAPKFHLTKAVRTLRPGHALRGTLRLTNHVPRAPRATPVGPTITTIINVPVTIVALPPAPPPGPAVTTGPASGLTLPVLNNGSGPPTATVSGLVNPRGEHTTFHFEYGPANGAYTSLAPTVDKIVNSDDHFEHVVSATLSGLESPSTVHYRVVATNADGTMFGDDQQFRCRSCSRPRAAPRRSTRPRPAGVAARHQQLLHRLARPHARWAGPHVHDLGLQPAAAGRRGRRRDDRGAPGQRGAGDPCTERNDGFEQTQSTVEPVPVDVPPQTTASGTVKFSVLQAPVFGTPEIAEQIGAAPSMATMPSTGRPDLDGSTSTCTDRRVTFLAGAEVDCTITIQNTGADNSRHHELRDDPIVGAGPRR